MFRLFNNKNQHILDTRVMTSFPVSIGTGIALEALFEPREARYADDMPTPDKIDINKYKTHYFNAYTLIRNIVASIATTDSRDAFIKSGDSIMLLATALLDEWFYITDLYKDTTCIPVLFKPDYRPVLKNIENSRYNTESKQKELETLYLQVILTLVQNDKEFKLDSYKLKADTSSVLLLSHYTLDLFNVKNVSNLDLLESHTGKVRKKSEFNKKYNKTKRIDVANLPFLEKLYYLLGGGVLITPINIKQRNSLFKIAIDKRWNKFTSESKIVNDILKCEDKELIKLYKKTRKYY